MFDLASEHDGLSRGRRGLGGRPVTELPGRPAHPAADELPSTLAEVGRILGRAFDESGIGEHPQMVRHAAGGNAE